MDRFSMASIHTLMYIKRSVPNFAHFKLSFLLHEAVANCYSNIMWATANHLSWNDHRRLPFCTTAPCTLSSASSVVLQTHITSLCVHHTTKYSSKHVKWTAESRSGTNSSSQPRQQRHNSVYSDKRQGMSADLLFLCMPVSLELSISLG